MPFKTEWTAEEEKFLIDNYALADSKIAELINGRFKKTLKKLTMRAVRCKRQRLSGGKFKKEAGRKNVTEKK